MTWNPILTLLAALSVASCAASNCAGWEEITTDKEETVDWLADNDPAFLRQIVTHNEFGGNCW